VKVTSPSGSNSVAVLRVVKQELDTVVFQLWRSQLATRFAPKLNRLLQTSSTRRLSVPTLVKLTGLGLGLLVLLRDWHLGLALGATVWGGSVVIKLSPSQRLKVWRHIQQVSAQQPLPVLLGAGLMVALFLGDGAESLLPWLGLGAVIGFGVGKAKIAPDPLAPTATPTSAIPTSTIPLAGSAALNRHLRDWQHWGQAIAHSEPLQRLLAVQHIQEWLIQETDDGSQLTPQRGRFLGRALQLRLQQEPEVAVQQAILEVLDALDVLTAFDQDAPVEIAQLPATLQDPLPLPQQRRPPAYQSQGQELPHLESLEW
jgi:hypothetical protein